MPEQKEEMDAPLEAATGIPAGWAGGQAAAPVLCRAKVAGAAQMAALCRSMGGLGQAGSSWVKPGG
ncbi:hypothetical protein HaLaN_11718, partial [Haematococcus lacustris]